MFLNKSYYEKLSFFLICGLLLFSCSKDTESDESQAQSEKPKFRVVPTTFYFGKEGGTAPFSCLYTAGKFERCYFVEHLTWDGFKFTPNEWTGRNQNLIVKCPPLPDYWHGRHGVCGAIYVDYKVPDERIITEHICYLYVHKE